MSFNLFKFDQGDQVQVEGIKGQAKIVGRNFGFHEHYDLPGNNYEVIFQSEIEGETFYLPETVMVLREKNLI